MKYFYSFLFLVSLSVFSQNTIETQFVSKTDFTADQFVDITNFNTFFFIKDQALLLQKESKTINYSNLQLGKITSASAFNSLKINVFYKPFNTVIILDNRLAEIFKIDFNTISPYKNITFVSTGSDNTLWLFNQNTMRLELFDYKTGKTRAKTMPIENNVIDIASDYNSCWLLTDDYLFHYNYFGSLITKIKNTGFTKLENNKNTLILKKENSLYYLNRNSNEFELITISDLLIKQFFVTNENLYLYDGKTIYNYQLKLK
jgi:hypothetical protein